MITVLTTEILVLLSISLICDIKTYKINNVITISFALIGAATNFFLKGSGGLVYSLLGWCVPVGVLFILFALRMLGAGDIKLFGAIGAVMGYKFALYSIMYSFLFGGVIAVAILITRKNSKERLKHLRLYLKSCFLSFRLLDYTDFEDKSRNDKFHFSYAVLLGTLLQLIIMLQGG